LSGKLMLLALGGCHRPHDRPALCQTATTRSSVLAAELLLQLRHLLLLLRKLHLELNAQCCLGLKGRSNSLKLGLQQTSPLLRRSGLYAHKGPGTYSARMR
jgi:hypothetical protein